MTRLSRAVRRQKAQARIAMGIWTAVAAVSLAAATTTALSERGMERVAGLIGPAGSGFAERIAAQVDGADLAGLSAQLAKLRSEVRLLALENEALATKLARIETDATTAIATASLPDASRREEMMAQPRQVYPPIPQPAEPAANAPEADAATAEMAELAAAEAREAETATRSTRFALEIGSGADIEELSGLWQALAERHDALLGGLEPKYGMVSGEDGAHRLLLRAGPISNAADAIAACAALRQRGTACSPVSDAGETLVMQ